MGLYFCRWPSRVSLLIHAASPGEALKTARDAADGAAPSSVAIFPRHVFIAEVVGDEDEDGPFLIEPLAHVADLLVELEDAPDVGPVVTQPAPAAGILCSSEATDDQNRIVKCELDAHKDGTHRAGDLEWP